MAVKNVVLARGHEGYRLRSRLCRSTYHRWGLGVLGKKIVPGFENSRMYQQDLPRDIACLVKIGVRSLAHINHRHMLDRSERGRPGQGNGAHPECGENRTAAPARGAGLMGRR